MSQNVGTIDLELLLKSDKFKSELKGLQGQANQASTQISGALSKIGKAALAAFSVTAVVKFGKACLDVATETSNAWIGLNSILTGQGKSFSQAQKFIQEYVSDGLIPLNNAVAAYKNLASRGYNTEQIQKTMEALKNASVYGRQSSYTMGEAVQSATEGLKNENSILVDNAGVTKNVAKMWEDYAKSVGKSTNQLTQAEKIQAEYNGILEETKFQMHDAETAQNTFTGKVSTLSQAFTNMKVAIGNVIQPIAKLFIPILTSAANAVTRLFTALAGLMAMFGLKADSVETVSNGIGDITNNAANASDAVEGIGDSAKKAAKNMKKSLAGFDEMNKLSDNSGNNSGSGSSGGSGAGGSELADALNVTTNIQQDTSAFDGMLNKVKELANIFKEGFNISFGDTNFDGILTHLGNIKNAVIDIFTDPKVLNSAQNWVNTLLYSLGQTVGAVARIGTNIIEGLVGSIDNYLSQNTERIKSFIIKMFDISSEDIALTGNLWKAFGEISDIFKGETAKKIGADIIAIFVNPLMSVTEYWAKLARDFRKLCVQPIIDNANKLKKSLENTLKPIQTITGKLAQGFTEIGDNMNKMYDEHLKPMFDSLTIGLSDTFSKFLDVYNLYVAPALQRIADKFAEVWDNAIQPMFEKAQALCGSIGDLITVLWENVLKPAVDWFVQTILPTLVPIFEAIWKTICRIVADISKIIGGVIDVFKGVIDFIVGVFTGNWNKAWEGIKTAFSGIWDALCGYVQLVIDKIVLVVEIFVAAIATKFAWIATKIKAILEAIKVVCISIWNGIKEFTTNAINTIKNNISTVFNTIKNIITNVLNGIKSTISTVIENIKTTITNVFNNIKNTISNVFNSIKTTASNIWGNIKTNIVNAVNNIKNGIVNAFQTAYNKITSIFNNIASFFTGIWNKVKNTFSELGTKIGDAISGAVKAGINGVLGMIENIVNKFVNMINGAIGAINNIPGVNISKLNQLSIPRLAQGGYAKANTPQLAVIGDNKTQGEIVSPVDKMKDTFLSALREFRDMYGGSGQDYVPIQITIPISIDGEEIQRNQDERKARLALATNGRRY